MRAPSGGGIRLTPLQARSLDVLGASVALTAGAGCGKTTVLTARFLSNLDPNGSLTLRSMAALTFTEKAARELRSRIRGRAREKLSLAEDVAHWRRVLRALEAAPIGTFHQFCAEWLRAHAVEAQVDPDFSILDESIAGTIRDEALATSLRRWLAESQPDLIALAVEFSLRSVREALGELVANRAAGDLAAWSERTPQAIVEIWREAWFSSERPFMLQTVKRALRDCCMLLESAGLDHPKLIERTAALAERLQDFDSQAEREGWLGELREVAKVPGGLRKTAWPSEAVNEAAKGVLEAVRKAADKFHENQTWSDEAALTAAEHGLRFARLALDARKAYEAAKRTRGGLDFDDLLLKTRELLHTASIDDRIKLAGAIGFLLVDEFQDTDPVQGEILRWLSGPGFAEGRLFLVGDSKQSIYRFRGARPRIFDEFRAEFPVPGHHHLSENFRSVREILDFVNVLFDDALGESGLPLLSGTHALSPRPEPAVEFLWAAEEREEGQAKPTAREVRRVEARWLARHLRRIVHEQWLIRDPKTKEGRPAEPKDIVLLFRAMTDVGPYETALHEEGIDYHTIGGAAFYAQQEITDLVNVLSVIEDPFDEVALAGALRSPFFCLSDDGLFMLASEPGCLPDRLRNPGKVAGLPDRDRELALRARDLLDRWRNHKDHEPIAALANRVLDESGYEAALVAEFLGPRKRANARKLVRMARAFDEQGGFTLAEFVAKLRSDLRHPPREEQASTTDEEGTAVRLMSIHQAKGLEFPIVVLPDLNRGSPNNTRTVAFDPELGPLVRLSDDSVQTPDGEEPAEGAGESLGWRIYEARERREDDGEALRLFYVATTRAMDLLILSAGAGPDDKPKSPAMKLLDARFNRETGTCRVPLPEGWAEPQVAVLLTEPDPLPEPVRARPWRPSLGEVAQVITSAECRSEVLAPGDRARPRYVDLDPALALPPSRARLDRLIRAILRDPSSLEVRNLPDLARRTARKLSPAATPQTVDQAVELLTPLLSGPLGVRLREAQTIERSLAWSIDQSANDGMPTILRGLFDLAYQDAQGAWHILNISLPEVSAPREHVRLLLSGKAAAARGLDPIVDGCCVRFGADGLIDEVKSFGDEAIRMTLSEL